MLHAQVKEKRSKIQNCQPSKLFFNSHCDVQPGKACQTFKQFTSLLLDPSSSICYLPILLLSLVMTTYLIALFLADSSAHIGSEINHFLDPSLLSALLLYMS